MKFRERERERIGGKYDERKYLFTLRENTDHKLEQVLSTLVWAMVLLSLSIYYKKPSYISDIVSVSDAVSVFVRRERES